ncbi:MAG: ribulose-phosphate 3-epimerase [Hespellia sp.]|nr:ribulose-phosphate 3-epimerase [Hespellia sp.]
MEYILAPSILAADFTKLGEEIKGTEEQGAKFLHFDVMDGMFVPSISFGIPVLQSIRPATQQVLDAHLMIEEPIRYVEEFAKAGADYITVHLEACSDVKATLQKIRDLHVKVGISIKPNTPVSALEAYLPMVDMVLIMSVEPGFGGQKFMESSLGKIRELRNIISEHQYKIDIQVDGGIKVDNVEKVLDAGANIIVAGSAVFNEDVAGSTKKFMEIIGRYE